MIHPFRVRPISLEKETRRGKEEEQEGINRTPNPSQDRIDYDELVTLDQIVR